MEDSKAFLGKKKSPEALDIEAMLKNAEASFRAEMRKNKMDTNAVA